MLVFLLAGTFSMSASICASKLLKLPEEEQPQWVRGKSGKVRVLLTGNLFAVLLVAAMVYGVMHLTWWIPVVCLFITFPVLHVVILERLLGASRGFLFSGVLSVGAAVLMGVYW